MIRKLAEWWCCSGRLSQAQGPLLVARDGDRQLEPPLAPLRVVAMGGASSLLHLGFVISDSDRPWLAVVINGLLLEWGDDAVLFCRIYARKLLPD